MAFDDVATDDVAPESDVALTFDILLVQRVNFQPYQPTTQRHISLLEYKSFMDTLVEIKSNVGWFTDTFRNVGTMVKHWLKPGYRE